MSSSIKEEWQRQLAVRIADQIRRGESFLVNKSEAGELKAPINAVTGMPYSSINRLILTSPGENDPRWMTRNQAEEQGYFIRYGTKPRKLVFWESTTKVVVKGEDGKPERDSEGRVKMKTVRLERPEIRFYDVYHAKGLERPDGQEMPPYEETRETGNPVDRAKTILENSGVKIVPELLAQNVVSRPKENILVTPDPKVGPLEENRYLSLVMNGLCDQAAFNQGQITLDDLMLKQPLETVIASTIVTQDLGLPSLPFGDGPLSGPDISVIEMWASELEKDPNMLFRACTNAEKIKEQVLSLEKGINQERAANEPVKLSVPFTQRQEAKELGAYFIPEEKLWVSSPVNKNLPELTSRWPYDPEKHTQKDAQEVKTPKRAYLDVPFEEKDRAKDLGAKFDFRKKQWYVEPEKDLALFTEWLSENDRKTLPVMTPDEEFGEVLKKAGLVLDGHPVMDGKPHKVPVAGQKRGAAQGTYCFMPDISKPSFYMNHVSGESNSWSYSGQMLSEVKKAELNEELESKKAELRQERTVVEQKAIDGIMDKFAQTTEAANNHPYLVANEIWKNGLRLDAGHNLVGVAVNIDQSFKDGQFVPRPQTLFTITPEGQTSIEPGTKANGAALLIGQKQFGAIVNNPDAEHDVLVAPDYETGAVLHEYSRSPVAVAFGVQNMQSVAKALRKRLPNARITVCINHDKTPQKQTSLEKANKIADSVGGKITVLQPPLTKEQLTQGLTSFNDEIRALRKQSAVIVKETDKKPGLGR